jgi:hypothetical protein
MGVEEITERKKNKSHIPSGEGGSGEIPVSEITVSAEDLT